MKVHMSSCVISDLHRISFNSKLVDTNLVETTGVPTETRIALVLPNFHDSGASQEQFRGIAITCLGCTVAHGLFYLPQVPMSNRYDVYCSDYDPYS